MYCLMFRTATTSNSAKLGLPLLHDITLSTLVVCTSASARTLTLLLRRPSMRCGDQNLNQRACRIMQPRPIFAVEHRRLSLRRLLPEALGLPLAQELLRDRLQFRRRAHVSGEHRPSCVSVQTNLDGMTAASERVFDRFASSDQLCRFLLPVLSKKSKFGVAISGRRKLTLSRNMQRCYLDLRWADLARWNRSSCDGLCAEEKQSRKTYLAPAVRYNPTGMNTHHRWCLLQLVRLFNDLLVTRSGQRQTADAGSIYRVM
jgi:hypothetical protein